MGKTTRGKKNPATIGVHIGNLLAEKINQQRISKSAMARRIGRSVTAISPLLKRPSMQAYLLWELSIALGYDFFHHLSEALLAKAGEQIVSGIGSDKAAIAALEKEVNALRTENNYLKKMIDVMAK